MWRFPTDVPFWKPKAKVPEAKSWSPPANRMVSSRCRGAFNHVLWLRSAPSIINSSSTQPSVSPLKPLCRKSSDPCARAELKPWFNVDEHIHNLNLYTFYIHTLYILGNYRWSVCCWLSPQNISERRESACPCTASLPYPHLWPHYHCPIKSRINYNFIHSYIQCDITKSGVVERLGQFANPLSLFFFFIHLHRLPHMLLTGSQAVRSARDGALACMLCLQLEKYELINQ